MKGEAEARGDAHPVPQVQCCEVWVWQEKRHDTATSRSSVIVFTRWKCPPARSCNPSCYLAASLQYLELTQPLHGELPLELSSTRGPTCEPGAVSSVGVAQAERGQLSAHRLHQPQDVLVADAKVTVKLHSLEAQRGVLLRHKAH